MRSSSTRVSEAGPRRVEGGGAHAVVGRDTDDVDGGRRRARAASPRASARLLRPRTRTPRTPSRPRRGCPWRRPRRRGRVRDRDGTRRPGADPAVRRPAVDVVGVVGEVVAGVDVVVAGRGDHRVVGRPSLRRNALICAATAEPPATASDPPSQKSFCTSTMSRARCAGAAHVTTVDRSVVHGEGRVRRVSGDEDGRDRGLAVRELEALPGQLVQALRDESARLRQGPGDRSTCSPSRTIATSSSRCSSD